MVLQSKLCPPVSGSKKKEKKNNNKKKKNKTTTKTNTKNDKTSRVAWKGTAGGTPYVAVLGQLDWFETSRDSQKKHAYMSDYITENHPPPTAD